MDNDCIPDLVVIADTGNKICILDSRTGKLKHYFNTIFLETSFSSLLVADINKDGVKEIIVVTLDNSINDIPYESRIACYDYTGKLLWVSNVNYYSITNQQEFPTLGIADFNQDGIPEVYC